jgi:polygalacturonase
MKNLILMLLLTSLTFQARAKEYLITNYGAIAGGTKDNTTAIQKAIDNCSLKGGGKVIVPAGNFLSRMLVLKDNVNLFLESGATISAIANGAKYISLVLIDQADNVSISGTGTLFGNGGNFGIKEEGPDRPYIVYVRNSKNILIENISLRQPAAWTLRLFGGEHITIRGISIYAHANFNNDGIDIDSKDVIITGCIIDSGDDAICLKSEDPKRITENIIVSNCIVASNCNLIKMGTGSLGGFKNVTISNCVLRRASESPLHDWSGASHFIDDRVSGIAGIALEIVDGGALDQISISNISMTGIQTPIFLRLGNRKNLPGTFRNVIISNVVATYNSRMSVIIAGIPGNLIENITLRDIILNGPGGGTKEDAIRPVPENEKHYPENRMFGWTIPASALYIRHARNLIIENFQVNLKEKDVRPALNLEDVRDLDATHLKLNGILVDKALIKSSNIQNISINSMLIH